MSITSVKEHPAGRGKTDNENGSSQYTKQYIVIVSDVTVTEDEVLADTRIPLKGSAHPSNSKALLDKRTPSPYGDQRIVWMVDLTYTTAPRKPAITTAAKPWNYRPKLKWTNYAATKSILEDKDGAAIMNSAKDPLNPPLEIEEHYPILSITRYERNYSITKAMGYIDKVNLTAMVIAGLPVDVEQAKITEFTGSNALIDGVECWEVNYQITFASTWVQRVLDQGFYYYPGGYDVGTQTPFTDKAGDNLVNMGLLTSSGDKASPTNPHFLEFKVSLRKEFGPLGLPKRAN